jgi:hypothetical protein
LRAETIHIIVDFQQQQADRFDTTSGLDNVVESANDLAILSSIEIIWCSGKNCWVVGTVHIIVDFQQQTSDMHVVESVDV